MSYSYRTRFGGVKIDWVAVTLMALMATMQLFAVYFQPFADVVTTLSGGPDSQVSNPLFGVGFVGVVVVESLAIIALWRYARSIFELIIKVLKVTLFLGIMAAAIYTAVTFPGMRPTFIGVLVAVGALSVVAKLGYGWIVHNLNAFLMAALITSIFASLVTPRVAAVVLVLAMVWDRIAVFAKPWMMELVSFSSVVGIPNYFIIPSKPVVDLDAVTEWLEDPANTDRPDGVAMFIGAGDFAMPSLLVVSAAISSPSLEPAIGAAIGSIAALAVLRSAVTDAEGGLPALQWLSSAPLVGFALGTGVMIL